MQNRQIFIPKDHPELPDCYGLIVEYIDGRSETIEIVSHSINGTAEHQKNLVSFTTHDDEFGWIPLYNVKKVKLDKRWTKILEIKREMAFKKPQEETAVADATK